MRKTALLLGVLLTFTAMVLAQAASTESGEHAKHKAAGGNGTLTGCLSGPNEEGAYVLTNAKGRKVEVGGSDDLKAHVGHEVKLTGTWEKSGAAIGENEKNEKHESGEKGEKGEKGEGAHRHFKVSKIDHVSDTCKQTSASAKGGEHHHHHADADASNNPK
jgi:hypothetical protein